MKKNNFKGQKGSKVGGSNQFGPSENTRSQTRDRRKYATQAALMPYLQPMSKAAIQALQTLGEEDLINHACLTEFQKGVSQAALMRRYDVGRDHLYKILHGKTRPGGTQ